MDAPAALRLRHTLYAVDAALIFHFGICALADYGKLYLFHASNADFIYVQCLHFPALALRIVHIHPIDLRRKQRRFISARTGADLYNYILIIIRILWKQQNLQLLFQLLHALFVLAQSLL